MKIFYTAMVILHSIWCWSQTQNENIILNPEANTLSIRSNGYEIILNENSFYYVTKPRIPGLLSPFCIHVEKGFEFPVFTSGMSQNMPSKALYNNQLIEISFNNMPWYISCEIKPYLFNLETNILIPNNGVLKLFIHIEDTDYLRLNNRPEGSISEYVSSKNGQAGLECKLGNVRNTLHCKVYLNSFDLKKTNPFSGLDKASLTFTTAQIKQFFTEGLVIDLEYINN